MRSLTPPYLVSAIVFFAIIFSVAVFVTQQIDSPAAVVLAPKLSVDASVPKLSAPVFRVFDIVTGEVLVSKDEKKVVPIASVTKLFAAATLVASFNLQATATVVFADLVGGGDAGKLAYGQTFTYQNLLFPLLLESSNDAASTFVRTTGGELLKKMNERAQALGASSTVFLDASGLSNGNVSSASDMQLLLTDAFLHQAHVFDITTLPQYINHYTGWINNNPVAKEVGYRGGKHGYTTAAGRTIVAIFDEEVAGRTYTLGYILFGSTDIVSDVATLRSFITSSASKP